MYYVLLVCVCRSGVFVRILCLRALFAEQIFDFDGIMARELFFLIRIVLLAAQQYVLSEGRA